MFTLNSIVLPPYYNYVNNNNDLYQRPFYNNISNYRLNNSINYTDEFNIMESGLRNNALTNIPNINMTISPKKNKKKKKKRRRKKNISTQNKNNNLFNIFNLFYIRIGIISIFGIALFTYYHKK
jgi:hypothetical protein